MTTNLDATPSSPARDRFILLRGVGLGVLYGLFLRLLIGSEFVRDWIARYDHFNVTLIMTASFIFFGPLVIGILTIGRAEKYSQTSIWEWVFGPWVAVLLMMLAAGLLAWEGSICIVMATPIALLCSSIGGVCAGAYARWQKPSTATLTCIAVLPFILAPVEAHLTAPTQTRSVSSEIRIHAKPQVVWQNIERVPAISPAELRPGWAQRIGFPRPVEATLSYEGIGGVRHASFEYGLLFIETITTWQPEQRLGFTIKADSAHIPPTTLDEHVTIGGRYFDVLDGEYIIEPLSGGDVLLHLVSHQRLSTDFNGYAGLWTDAVMQNLQSSILAVIQRRCEHT